MTFPKWKGVCLTLATCWKPGVAGPVSPMGGKSAARAALATAPDGGGPGGGAWREKTPRTVGIGSLLPSKLFRPNARQDQVGGTT